MSADLSWLVARPIAHRGLHDLSKGAVENSLAAAGAAIARNYGIECDVQLARDGEAIVFHDDRLDRLTEAQGRVDALSSGQLTRLALKGSTGTIPTLAQWLDLVAGRAPLVVELKSRFDGDLKLARRVAALLADYRGPVALESFDPEPIAMLRAESAGLGTAHVALGLVAQARYEEDEWPELSPERRVELLAWTHFARTRPQFVSFNVEDLPHAVPSLFRQGLGAPVTVWTVRSKMQAENARRFADQIVFEGFSA